MSKEDFLDIIQKEQLIKPMLNRNPNNLVNVFGYYYNEGWIVYETDERATVFRSKTFETEEKALLELLEWLRDQHYIDSL